MREQQFRGTGTALVTPFASDGTIDEKTLRKLVEYQISEGIDMLLPCGTTGEGATLEPDETDKVVQIVIDQASGRVPVIVGAGSNSTAKAVRATKRAKQLGASGVLSVGPYYNKPTQQGLYEHFRSVAEAEDIPIIVYNVPPRTASNIEPATILRLAEIRNIAGVKEASGSIGQIMEILRARPAGFRVLSGDDSITLPLVSLGADGVVSVISNEAPGMMRAMVDAALDGDFVQARAIHYRLLPLMNANFIESSPIPVKAVLAMMGMIEENYRLPLVPMNPANREKLRGIVEKLGLLQHAGV
jgi:4-hydroxy-tetrahydrodipicolinate synthase